MGAETVNMDMVVKIAGSLTIGDWLDLEKKLESDLGNNELWEKAFAFYEQRIIKRYMNPIEAIQKNADAQGEGFAICAILCSLVEALESFYQGKSYRKATAQRPLDNDAEYFKSQPIFENFLTQRTPFNTHFTKDLASDFYENFRCSILHEAATRSGWVIRIGKNDLLTKENGKLIIDRNIFLSSIKEFMRSYKRELLNDNKLKAAFIRKMKAICETA